MILNIASISVWGRDQFSVENANNVQYCTLCDIASLGCLICGGRCLRDEIRLITRSAPLVWPIDLGIEWSSAHLEFPSQMKAM